LALGQDVMRSNAGDATIYDTTILVDLLKVAPASPLT